MEPLALLEWFATACGIFGAALLAARVRWSPYGFVLFLFSSLAWTVAAYGGNQWALLVNQLVFVAINVMGVARWVPRASQEPTEALPHGDTRSSRPASSG